ncbi:hypothetical protein [Bradyrhizobium sp.]|uniref:hypothetical protein n=1 Tax=Bradyrhizobium sp. TaxID=376 RepID=UPI000A88EBFE|nr:hypothetical protein [Bradyrhizobium sp.]
MGDLHGNKNVLLAACSAHPDFAIEALQSARAGFLVSPALFLTLIMICPHSWRGRAVHLHEVEALRLIRADFCRLS